MVRVTSPVGPWRFEDSPVESWTSTAWLHSLGLRVEEFRGRFGEESRTWIDAVDSRYRRSVDAEALFLFVIVYLLVAGPGLFLFLKRKGRLPWLLWMQPAVVGVFLVITGLLGWAHHGVASRTDHTPINAPRPMPASAAPTRTREVASSRPTTTPRAAPTPAETTAEGCASGQQKAAAVAA